MVERQGSFCTHYSVVSGGGYNFPLAAGEFPVPRTIPDTDNSSNGQNLSVAEEIPILPRVTFLTSNIGGLKFINQA